MCGIIAYVGTKPCRQIVLDGLARLEYREYDSAGFVCIDAKHNHFSFHKETGGLSPVKKLLESTTFDGIIGMAHTRWATHGIVAHNNAHPHFNCKKSIALVHNGIIEDHEELRQQLIDQGHDFSSSTDTEVVSHLFSTLLDQHKNVKKALLELVKRIKGAYALTFLLEQHPDMIVVVRHHLPMNIGFGDGEMFVASDLIAFPAHIKKVIFMPENTIACITKDGPELFGFDGHTVAYYLQEIDQSMLLTDKNDSRQYLLKEIYEQKRAINRTISFCKVIGNSFEDTFTDASSLNKNHQTAEYNDSIWRHIGLTVEKVKEIQNIHLVCAGSSWHAARIARLFFETVSNIPTYAHLASEFCYTPFFPNPSNVHIVISQSGETTDTLEALRFINSFEQHTVALTNVASSSMVREASGFLPMQAGPEIAGSSTKAFSTQVATLYWLAHRMALERGTITPEQMNAAEENVFVAAEILEASIDIYKFRIINQLASRYALYDRFIFVGKQISFPLAMEASLKLQELSGTFAHAFPAGELKHGSHELIDEQTPVVLFSVLDDVMYQKLILNAHDIKKRNGHLIVFAFEEQDELLSLADTSFVFPRVTPLLAPLAMAGVMQFFIYQLSQQQNNFLSRPHGGAKITPLA